MLTTILAFTRVHCLRTASLRSASLLLALLGLTACAATPVSLPGEASAGKAADASTSKEAAADTAKGDDSTEVAFVPPESENKEPAMQAAETQAVRIDVSCKNEPFSKYEKASRNSIAKGLNATTAELYGVGFRVLKEH